MFLYEEIIFVARRLSGGLNPMKDIQSLHDNRRINIRKVGVKTISYPVTVLDRARNVQKTVATVNMYVNLPHCFKGTHMSRFVEILNRFHGNFNLQSFHVILEEMKEKLEAEAAHLEIAFPYFLQPVTRESDIGTDRYMCRMHGSLEDTDDLVVTVEVPITPPQQQSVSGGLPRSTGQWGQARVAVRFHRFLWIEELVGLVEASISESSALPESVESVCQLIATALENHSAVSWYKVVVENLAHGYSIFAALSSGGSGGG